MTSMLHQLIERQAGRTPDRTAIVFEQQRLSYRELDRRANHLAQHLRALGAAPDGIVGLLVERSAESVVGILGILKAGSAYLPIDAGLPHERMAFMLADAGVKLLVTQTSLLPRLPVGLAHVVCLDSFDWSGNPAAGAQDQAPVQPENLAYVIYNSGSTIRPKGV